MKTAFKAKLIFESDKVADIYDNQTSLMEFTYHHMVEAINKGDITIEMIADYFAPNQEPVIIIKEKT